MMRPAALALGIAVSLSPGLGRLMLFPIDFMWT